MTGDGKIGIRAHFYPKGQAAQNSVDMQTAGDNIDLRTVSCDINFVEPKGCEYHMVKEFTGDAAEESANAWLDTMFGIS